MTLKLNKVCDLNSISVLPPQSSEVEFIFQWTKVFFDYGRSQTASQIRLQQTQLTLSQGASSQHGLFSQFSQNSQYEILTNKCHFIVPELGSDVSVSCASNKAVNKYKEAKPIVNHY
ncbi:hypothetical protein CASFOL_029204 [Castilleja foliolosa]|uniref:Uncharacterized protein n=1 Tax=Castilleja foliolosa TaxID=1961234 RepID=A0ABD3CB04_9LAMI